MLPALPALLHRNQDTTPSVVATRGVIFGAIRSWPSWDLVPPPRGAPKVSLKDTSTPTGNTMSLNAGPLGAGRRP